MARLETLPGYHFGHTATDIGTSTQEWLLPAPVY
jgi:hypothetical protein